MFWYVLISWFRIVLANILFSSRLVGFLPLGSGKSNSYLSSWQKINDAPSATYRVSTSEMYHGWNNTDYFLSGHRILM